jgi:hypothetical protein
MHDHDHEPISPELVLVDPELAARVRAVAVAGPSLDQPVTASPSVERSGGAGREPATPPPAAPASVPARTPAPAPAPARAPAPGIPTGAPARTRRPVTARLASLASTLAVLALLAAAFLPPRDAPRLTDSAAPATAAPRTSVTLAWLPASDADYYLVEVYSGTRLVHAQSVRGTRLSAPAWLRPGRYTWRVFSGQGRAADRRTRGPLESGWFVVTG